MYVYFIQETARYWLRSTNVKTQDLGFWLFFRKCRGLLPRTRCTRKSWCSRTWLKLDWKRVPIIDRRTSRGDISCNIFKSSWKWIYRISWSGDVFLDNRSNLVIIFFIIFDRSIQRYMKFSTFSIRIYYKGFIDLVVTCVTVFQFSLRWEQFVRQSCELKSKMRSGNHLCIRWQPETPLRAFYCLFLSAIASSSSLHVCIVHTHMERVHSTRATKRTFLLLKAIFHDTLL